jgi:hypothetical protein
MLMTERNSAAFEMGVLGFVAAAMVAGMIALVLHGFYLAGYDDAQRCFQFHIGNGCEEKR